MTGSYLENINIHNAQKKHGGGIRDNTWVIRYKNNCWNNGKELALYEHGNGGEAQ